MMARVYRLVIGAAIVAGVAAGLVACADPVLAQPPGGKGKFDFGKDGFDKKGFDKKGFDKKDSDRGPRGTSSDPIKGLEADLAKLKAAQADIEAKLKQLKKDDEPEPRRGGFGPPGGFGGRGPGGPGFGRGPGRPGGGSRGMSGVAEGITRAANTLSATQLKEVIEDLQKLRAEKLRAEAPSPRAKGGERSRPEARPESRPSQSSQDAVLKRLDQLSKEIDELRKSIKR
jgi:hypothetical protein